MFIKTKITIAAAVVLATAGMASAAGKHDRSGAALYDRATVPLGGDSDSPAATAGGSIGHNLNIYNW